MVYRKNHWLSDPQYKGINTRWLAPGGGRFELQFHTPESFDAKENRTHRSYERLRSALTTWPERRELNRYERLVSATVPRPEQVERIPDQQERE